jgi:hypothetical protein
LLQIIYCNIIFFCTRSYNFCCNTRYETKVPVKWIRLGPRVGFIKHKGLKYKFQHKSAPTIGPRVCFVKTEGLNCKTMSRLVSSTGSRSDGAGTTDFQPAIRRLTASVPHRRSSTLAWSLEAEKPSSCGFGGPGHHSSRRSRSKTAYATVSPLLRSSRTYVQPKKHRPKTWQESIFLATNTTTMCASRREATTHLRLHPMECYGQQEHQNTSH